jgi:hypothetical protein
MGHRSAAVLTAVVLLVTGSMGFGGASASAATAQEAWLQDDGALLRDPFGTMQRLRVLGVDRARVAVRWLAIAPRPNSHTRPHFDAANPAAYPAENWAGIDRIVKAAQADGIGLNFNIVGGAPLWATGRGAPADKPHPNWQPSTKELNLFVRAVGTRYSGNYDPDTHRTTPGDPGDLPAVSFWSIWNEPDYGPSLAPQGVPGNLTVEESPRLYRGLVDAAWTGLHQTGHGRDQILIGEIAPRGYDNFGLFNGMRPLQFLRALYCVDAGYHQLRGSAAALRGCPSTAAGSRAFRRAHPGLFEASGFADHPYSRWFPPNVERPNNPEYTSLADIGFLERGLDRLQRVYGSGKRFQIFNTEYGYLTSPPKHSTKRIPYISTTTAAQFLNQAEYMSWRDPRIRSFMQYLLADPLSATRSNDYGGFASGLLTFNQRPKPTYDAWRLPLFLPVTAAHRGRSLEVWGCARPVFFARQDDPAASEIVQIQFKRDSGGGFTTLRNIGVTNRFGYFDTRISPPSSGRVRLTWTYPSDDSLLSPGTTATSRSVQVKLR